MLIWLTSATKQRVVQELKRILYEHPRYRSESDNVYVKYSFDSRPQRGIIVNNATADRIRLSADNYMGRLSSFCMLTWVKDKPGTTIEWVRENFNQMERLSPRRDVFPSPPGSYLIEVQSLPDDGRGVPGTFTVEPILTSINQPLIIFQNSLDQYAQLPNDNIYPGSVRLWLDSSRGLLSGVDFTVNYETGEVSFLKETPTDSIVYADYRYLTAKRGPFNYFREKPDSDAIPGCILAFGDRPQECDKQAIVISEDRTEVADIYGGKYEVSFSLIIFSRDTEDREKMSDYVIQKFLEAQNNLGFEGLELLDISPGGENEEVYNAETDDYYYESSVSLSIRVDWESWVPLPAVVQRIEFTSKENEQAHGYMDGTYSSDLIQPTSRILERIPLIIGRELFFESIR